MEPFEYLAPATLDEALSALRDRQPDVMVIAGGTDLIPRMRKREVQPATLIDLRLLPLKHIRKNGKQVHIGACITHAQVIDSDLLAEHLPALVEACRHMAGPPVRNRGTIGGNLVTASPAADSAPTLMVYDAEVVLTSHKGQRTLPMADFFLGPGETARRPDELLTEVRAPLPGERTQAAFIKLGRRRAMAISVVSVAARITLDKKGTVAQARIALGSVAPTPLRAYEAETSLEGNALDQGAIEKAAKLARQSASPIDDLRASASYRSKMVEVLTRRALEMVKRGLEGGDA